MKSFQLPARTLTLDDSWDVIVAGGGPTGCTAAAAAAREGARTLLIEASGCLGGSGTSALVPAWCPFSDKEKIIYRGLAEKVFTAAKKDVRHVKGGDLDWVPIDAERLKRVYDDLVTEAGASILFHTVLSSVETEAGGTVSTIVVSNKAGLTALRAKVYIDCTGDADLAAWAGAETHKGDERGAMQPGTHCFILTNVDEYAYRHGPALYWTNPASPIHAILASGRYPEIPDHHICNNLVGPGAVGFNAGHLFHVDNTDPEGMSRALVAGRRMAVAYRDALAEFFPAAFGNAFLATTGSVVGIRETRRVVGDYVLTLQDYLDRRVFDDEICRNSYFIDLHETKKELAAKGEDWVSRFAHYGKGESHGIPYRCLTPRGLKNVLVAGRSISCERIVQGSIRVMPVCLAMGEAAGVAAALAAAGPVVDIHQLDTDLLRERLRAEGGYLPELPGETVRLATPMIVSAAVVA
ncbi:MAG: tat (twin-arginine translocation) pathway signal sequence [Rariglobus sp.]|jgi:glycine/D-amino acid oxidase-like deaminating enzyme|nr:tat (twin-arginine translocation) pathway signal sequence [Rariglobus sp.]